jgi:hypothetical protein
MGDPMINTTMIHRSPRFLVLGLFGAALGAGGCGPSPGGKVPVDSTFYAYQAPEEAVADEDDEDEGDADDADADDADDEDDAEKPAAAPAKPAAAPAKPAAAPAKPAKPGAK